MYIVTSVNKSTSFSFVVRRVILDENLQDVVICP